MATTYIFGHHNPDTDSICSAIAYAELKKKLGHDDVFAYRLGKMNKETQFVLDYFDVKTPPLLTDVKLKLKDLGLYNAIPLLPTDPLKKAWDTIGTSIGARIMPIVDDRGILIGIVSIGDITKIFMEIADEDLLEKYEISYDNLLKILDGQCVKGTYNYDSLCGRLIVGTPMFPLSELTDKDIIIIGRAEDAKNFANNTACGLVILTNGLKPIDVEKAKGNVVCVNHSTHRTITLLNQAISVRSVMCSKRIMTFSTENYVEDIIENMKTSSHRNFPVVNREGRLVGVISRRHLLEYKQKQVILVDHNERSQSVAGIENANIIEIIDHHRIADVQTDKPLMIRAEPVGCTSTIIFKMFTENGVKPTKKTAGLLLSAILSDTLMFTSPTCTDQDMAAAEKLAKIANVKMDELASQMFGASTSMSEYTPHDMLELDRKQFSIDKYLVYISQINTLDFKTIVNKRYELLDEMEIFKKEKRCDLVILMITDIVLGGSEIIVCGKAKELVKRAFGLEFDEASVFLPGVVSRKKQVVPRLTMAVQSL